MSRTRKLPMVSPSVATLAKLASIVVHVQEAYAEGGHEFDIAALRALANDADVCEWVEGMQKMAMAPLKRSPPTVSGDRSD